MSDFYADVIYNTMTEKEIRAEYSRLRSVARKRIERLGRSEFNTSQTYLSNRGRFVPLAEVKNKQQAAKLLADVELFVSAKTSSISGLKRARKESIQSLRAHGYNFVNQENFKAFTEFMEEWRDLNARSAGSPTPEQLKDYMQVNKKNMTAAEAERGFQKFLDDHS